MLRFALYWTAYFSLAAFMPLAAHSAAPTSEAVMEVLQRAKPAIAAHWAGTLAAKLPGHTKARTAKVDAALELYFKTISRADVLGKRAKILAAMKTLFATLDEINEEADGGLLETDERELLVPVIIDGAAAAGLDPQEFEGGDPTGPFRNF